MRRLGVAKVTINTTARLLDRFFLSTPTQLPRFSPFLLVICLIGCRNGPLHSFRSRCPCLLHTCCWPVYRRTLTDRSRCQWCPDIPSNSAGLTALPLYRLSAYFLQII